MKAVPVSVPVLARDQQSRVHRRAEIRLHAGGVCRHHPIGIVHRWLDDVGVLNRAVDVREGEGLDRIRFSDLLVQRHPVIARHPKCKCRLILMMARGTDLFVGRVPGRLRLLNRRDRAGSRVTHLGGLRFLCGHRGRQPNDTRHTNTQSSHEPLHQSASKAGLTASKAGLKTRLYALPLPCRCPAAYPCPLPPT